MTYTYEIIQDENAQSPREWGNAAVMACWHRNYNLGDDKKNWDCPNDPDEFVEWAKANRVIYLPLYLYDHSGITMRTRPFGCRWDSGQVGYIYLTRETILKEWGWKVLSAKRVKWLEKHMRGQVEAYDQYLTGDVWGYVVKDEDEDGEEVDSCWGFFGHEHCESEVKEVFAHIELTEPKQAELEFV